MEVYISSTRTLDDVAQIIRELFNLRDQNRSAYRVSQRREGVNRGGLYYLFEVLGLKLTLLVNKGEVEIPEKEGFSYYLMVEGGKDDGTNRVVAEHLAQTLRESDLECEVNDLSW